MANMRVKVWEIKEYNFWDSGWVKPICYVQYGVSEELVREYVKLKYGYDNVVIRVEVINVDVIGEAIVAKLRNKE